MNLALSVIVPLDRTGPDMLRRIAEGSERPVFELACKIKVGKTQHIHGILSIAVGSKDQAIAIAELLTKQNGF